MIQACLCGLDRAAAPGDRGLRVFYYEKIFSPGILKFLRGQLRDGAQHGARTEELSGERLVDKAVPVTLLRALTGDSDLSVMPDPRTGKPRLSGHPGFYFNIAHSARHLVLGAASGMDIGVDVESEDSAADALCAAQAFLSPAERRLLDREASGYATSVLRLWTMKEAAAKLSGAGVYADFRALDFSCAPAPGGAAFRAGSGWMLLPGIGKGVLAAVALAKKPLDVRLYELRLGACCMAEARGASRRGGPVNRRESR